MLLRAEMSGSPSIGTFKLDETVEAHTYKESSQAKEEIVVKI